MALVAGSRAEVRVDVNGTTEARREIESVGDVMSGLGGKISAMAGTLGAVVGALAGVAAFGSWIKGAIDATDAASDLSQKTGIAIKDLAGLELAYQMGGMEAEALVSTQTKLSKAMVDGNATLEKLGISSKNLDGSLKSNKEVMYAVADSFAGMDDGARKTALAMDLFGKSGADMIPMLNGGSEGMRELDEMAAKLGLRLGDKTVDQAGRFNDTLDLLKLGGQGVARGIAAELLPTLSSLAGSFLTAMTEGDRLKTVGQLIAGVFKTLYTVAVSAVETFSTVGKVIGGFADMIKTNLTGAIDVLSKVAGGDFTGAWDTVKRTATAASGVAVDVASDVSKGWVGAWNNVVNVWTGGGNEMVDTMVTIKRASEAAQLTAAEVAKRTAAAHKERAAEAKVLAELSGVTATYMEDLSQLYAMYQKGSVTQEQYNDLVVQLIAKQPGAKKAMDDAAKAAADYEKATDNARKAVDSGVDSILEQASALETTVATYGLLPNAVTAVSIAELEAAKQSLVLTEQGLDDIQRKIDALKRLQKAQGSLQEKETAAAGAKAVADEWKRTTDSIEQSLTDALMRGFESGKGFGQNLVDTIKNMFNTLVLRPIVSAVVNPVAGAITGAMGVAAPAAAASGGGGAAGGLGMSAIGAAVGSYFGAGGIAGSVMAGAGWLTGATTLSGSLAAAGSLAATGTLGGIASSLGMVAGALGPIALGLGAAVALVKKFDDSGTAHTGGASSASSAGVSTIRAESLGFQHTKVSTEANTMTAQLASGIVGILDSTALAFGKTAGYSAATAFADDTSKDGAWGALVIQKMGQDIVDWNDTRQSKWAPREFANGEKGQEQYLALLSQSVRTALDGIGLPEWARTMLNKVASNASLEELAKVVEQINVTQSALSAMRAQLVGFSSLGDAAVSALMAASGGIEKLFSNASAYYDAFYSESEKNAAASGQIAQALAAVNLQMPSTREGYRALVEAQMRLGTAGAEAVSVLLSYAGAFAQVTPEVQAATVDLTSYRSALTEAYNAESTALQSTIARMGTFATSLRNLKDSALLGNLSPLSPSQKYAEARSQYEAVLAAARAGDEGAQGRYQEVYTAFLEASRAVNASSIGYTRDFEYAQAATEEAAKWAGQQVDVYKAQLDVLKLQVSGIIEVNKSVLSVREALLQYNAAAGKNTAPLTGYVPVNPPPIVAGRTSQASMDAVVTATKMLGGEVAKLRSEQAQHTAALIATQTRTSSESAAAITGAVKSTASTEYRVLPS